jgi:cell division protein FtsB
MQSFLDDLLNSRRIKQLSDPRNIGLYIFAIIVLAIAWSSARTVQKNYDLQKQIASLQQQNSVLELENQNTDLQNKYYTTDQYLELAARQSLGLAAPGEKVMLIPKNVAMKYVNPDLIAKSSTPTDVVQKKAAYRKNLEDWHDFLLGRRLFD